MTLLERLRRRATDYEKLAEWHAERAAAGAPGMGRRRRVRGDRDSAPGGRSGRGGRSIRGCAGEGVPVGVLRERSGSEGAVDRQRAQRRPASRAGVDRRTHVEGRSGSRCARSDEHRHARQVAVEHVVGQRRLPTPTAHESADRRPLGLRSLLCSTTRATCRSAIAIATHTRRRRPVIGRARRPRPLGRAPLPPSFS